MRIKSRVENIDYSDTQHFFENRIKRFNSDNPYSLTMYQDNNPELVKKRNQAEVKRLLPLLKLDAESKVLDIACGIGRWSDAIDAEIKEYVGIDFCQSFIDLANERNTKANRFFYNAHSTDVADCLRAHGKGRYNRAIIVGGLMYLNDEDVQKTLEQIEMVAEKETILCIREPIGINERLTLKEHFSEELGDTYNAVYRTRDEIFDYLNRIFISAGYVMKEEDFLFHNTDLSNRKETAQYYFLLERK